MNAILDQQEYEKTKETEINMALVAGYIRTWKDVDNNNHYELTEKGIKRLATLMV